MIIRLLVTFSICSFISMAHSESCDFETSADQISIDSEKGEYILEGQAVVKDSKRVFKADKIVVYKTKEQKKPTKAKAFGNVSYNDKDISITSKECETDFVRVIFSQSVIIRNSEIGVIEADKAIYNISTKKMDLRSKKKVRLTLDKKVESKAFGKGKRK